MVKPIRIYIEGAGNRKDERVRCRAAFNRLLQNAGFGGRMPSLIASGGRGQAFGDFKGALTTHLDEVVLLLVDSEESLPQTSEDPDNPFGWQHLKQRDNWDKPQGVENYQALLMATTMETWVAADIETLKTHYGKGFRESALPSLVNIESRNKVEILTALEKATKDTTKPYKKGDRSFEILGKLNATVLTNNLTHFRRFKAVLETLTP